MNKQTLLFVVGAWVIWIIAQYYLLLYFLVPLWLLISAGLFIVFLSELIKLIQERKSLSRSRVYKAVLFFLLFFFTFHDTLINSAIEKVDWAIFYNRRISIIQQVKNGELNPDVNPNNPICKLPYNFPIVSNGGNDIEIVRNAQSNSITVTFYIFRNYMQAPINRVDIY